jgi:hypothetical protein
MDLSKFSRDELIVAGASLLFAIDLLFLPWISFGPFSSSGTGAPDGWLGVIGMLAALALVADIAIDRLSTTQLPSIGGSRGTTRLVLAGVAVGCAALKLLLHVSNTFNYAGFGFWAAIVLAVVMIVVSVRAGDVISATS